MQFKNKPAPTLLWLPMFLLHRNQISNEMHPLSAPCPQKVSYIVLTSTIGQISPEAYSWGISKNFWKATKREMFELLCLQNICLACLQCAKIIVPCEEMCQLEFEVGSKLISRPAWTITEQDKHFLPVWLFEHYNKAALQCFILQVWKFVQNRNKNIVRRQHISKQRF